MMNNNYIILTITALISFVFTSESLWDLGVIIEKENKTISQKEIDISNFSKPPINIHQKNIKALHSNNFIKPILYEIKSPIISASTIINKYDDMFKKLSLSEQLLNIKKCFLNKEFNKFFKIHKNLYANTNPMINLMYIQNLYYTNKLDKAEDVLNNLDTKKMSDELLLYKVKTSLKLKKTDEALILINLFINKYPNSKLKHYIIYEKKLIMSNQYD